MKFILALTMYLLGGVTGWAIGLSNGVNLIITLKEPYCESKSIQGKEFTRCWKIVEIE